MSISRPFHPVHAGIVTLAAGVAQTFAVDPNHGEQRVLYNAGPSLAFYNIGPVTFSADGTGHALPAGAIITISLNPVNDLFISFFSAGVSTVYASSGEGA